MAASMGYAPQRLLSTANLTPAEALHDVAAYLTAAATDASLHPNALLTESGPTAVSQGEASFGIALYNLRRLQSGLRGERLVPDSDLLREQMNSAPTTTGKDVPSTPKSAAATDSDWQDREEFEHDQGVEQAPAEGTEALVVREEASERTGAVAMKAKKRAREQAGQSDGANGVAAHSTLYNSSLNAKDDAERKALRKKMKKERGKEEKRAKAERHQKAKEET